MTDVKKETEIQANSNFNPKIPLEGENKQKIVKLQVNTSQKIENIIEFINSTIEIHNKENSQKKLKNIKKDIILNHDKWRFDKVTPKSRRSKSPLNCQRRINESASLLNYLKYQLDKLPVNADKTRIQINKHKETLLTVGLNAQLTITEVVACHYLDEIQKINSDKKWKSEAFVELKDDINKYNLNSKYTSAEIGKHRFNTLLKYEQAIEETCKIYQNDNGTRELILGNLYQSRELFKTKCDIQFDIPTVGSYKKRARQLATLGCSSLSLVTGFAATVCAIVSASVVTAPVTVPLAVILGTTSAGFGLTSLTMTGANSAENYLRYNIKPTSGEKISIGLGVASLGLAGAGATGITTTIGPIAEAGGQIVSQGFNTFKNAYTAGKIAFNTTFKRKKENFRDQAIQNNQQANDKGPKTNTM